MARRLIDTREILTRAGVLVGASTLALTASFVGLIALATGEAIGVSARMPFYVLAMGIAFVSVIVLLEEHRADGQTVIVTAVVIALASFGLVSLAGEGMAYAIRHPERVVGSQLVFYFLAAGLIGTGLGYWGLHHWREFTENTESAL